MKHTKEPWRYKLVYDCGIHHHGVLGPVHPVDGGDYAPLAVLSDKADAERIVACVNACKGIEQQDLSAIISEDLFREFQHKADALLVLDGEAWVTFPRDCNNQVIWAEKSKPFDTARAAMEAALKAAGIGFCNPNGPDRP